MKKYYVVKVRYVGEECVFLFTAEEAKEKRWIDDNGNRIWVVPPKEERTYTGVYGFDDLDKAVEFYDILVNNQIGMKVCSY